MRRAIRSPSVKRRSISFQPRWLSPPATASRTRSWTRASSSYARRSEAMNSRMLSGHADALALSKSCKPTSAEGVRCVLWAASQIKRGGLPMAVNGCGLGSSADGKGEEGIDRSFERTSAPLYLSEEKSSLERGEQSDGEVIRVDVGRELPVGLEGSEPFADCGCPPFEPGSD